MAAPDREYDVIVLSPDAKTGKANREDVLFSPKSKQPFRTLLIPKSSTSLNSAAPPSPSPNPAASKIHPKFRIIASSKAAPTPSRAPRPSKLSESYIAADESPPTEGQTPPKPAKKTSLMPFKLKKALATFTKSTVAEAAPSTPVKTAPPPNKDDIQSYGKDVFNPILIPDSPISTPRQLKRKLDSLEEIVVPLPKSVRKTLAQASPAGSRLSLVPKFLQKLKPKNIVQHRLIAASPLKPGSPIRTVRFRTARERRELLRKKLALKYPEEATATKNFIDSFAVNPTYKVRPSLTSLPLPDKDSNAGFWEAQSTDQHTHPAANSPPVHIFVDFSNLVYGFQRWCEKKLPRTHPALRKMRPPLDLLDLIGVLERARNVKTRYLACSAPIYQDMTEAVEQGGYTVAIMQRVKVPLQDTGHRGGNWKEKEQGVDELIQSQMSRAIIKQSIDEKQSQTPVTERPVMVLGSGDANRSEFDSQGFLGRVQDALELGWNVEIVAFLESLNSAWKAERLKNSEEGTRGKLSIFLLDQVAEELIK